MNQVRNFGYLFGLNPVMEKLKAAPGEISEIIIAQGAQRRALRSLEEDAKRLGLRVVHLPNQALDRLSEGQKHQGVLARVDTYAYLQFTDLLQRAGTLAGPEWILLLDGITDPRNFGALLRTAEAAGAKNVVIPKDRAVGVTPVVIKASAGATHYVSIYRVANLRRTILDLKKKGFWIVGLDPQAEESVHHRVHPEKLGIVLGSEGSGIRPLIKRECDYLASIPLRGKIGSLNVAVSGAIFLYELLRQTEKRG